MDPDVQSFLGDVPAGVLATHRPDGGIRQSVVYFAVDGDRLFISTESKRGKARDVEAKRWASLCVLGPEKPHPSVTLEGPARVLRANIGEPTAAVFERMTGAPPSETLHDEDLAAVDRVVIEITVERVYGKSHIGAGP